MTELSGTWNTIYKLENRNGSSNEVGKKLVKQKDIYFLLSSY